MNRTYGTGWNDWEEVEPTIICTSRKDFIAFLDSCEYIEWYCQKYFEYIASIYRASGIDVPFYVNSTGGPFPHDPARLKGITCMTDLYYLGALPSMLPFNAKLLKATQPVTASAEFRCGTFGQLMTNTVYANQAMQWMAHGFHGVNYFMIVERHRWPNCPIDAVGRPGTPGRYATFKKIIGAYNRTRYPRFANGMVADVNLFWWRHHAFFIKPDPTEPYSSGSLLDPKTNFNTAFKALLEGNVGFDFYYPRAPRNVKHPCMIYAGHDYLDPGIARSLLDFALDGGTLVLYYNHPVKTVDGDPVDTFNRYVAPTRGVHLHGYHASIQVGECDRDGFPEAFSTYTSLLVDLDIDSNPIEGSVPYMHKHMVVGQSVPAGRGCIVQVGWDLTPTSIHGFLKSLGFKAPLRVNQDGVCCTLLQDKDEYLVGIVEQEGKARQNLRINFDTDKILLDDFDLVESVFQGRKIIKKGNGISVTIPAGEGDLVWIHGRD
ncbi:hypothetical protein GF325_05475 [Candidatus Bathyarchaeota archaeon]|nr:hypothetical protein [Candidatus Bathyarchaeota archaeon]